mmetsp:Transcript_4368/g.12149  ORF Transcript_4368/g.12149 Transcript_4368/m.12149 type:complete len:359 (-) Transcript_4368:856-1932(-)
MLRVLAVVLHLLPDLREDVNVHVSHPRRLRLLPALQDEVGVALEDPKLLVLDVIRDFGLLRLPKDHHEAKQRRALLVGEVSARRNLADFAATANDLALCPTCGRLARGGVAILVARVRLAILEAPIAGDLVATLCRRTVLARPRAFHEPGDVRLGTVDLFADLLDGFLLRLVAADAGRVHVVPFMDLPRRLAEQVATIIAGREDRLSAALMVQTPSRTLLRRAHIDVNKDGVERRCVRRLAEAGPGHVHTNAVRLRLLFRLLLQLLHMSGLLVDRFLLGLRIFGKAFCHHQVPLRLILGCLRGKHGLLRIRLRDHSLADGVRVLHTPVRGGRRLILRLLEPLGCLVIFSARSIQGLGR